MIGVIVDQAVVGDCERVTEPVTELIEKTGVPLESPSTVGHLEV
jgi:hypothetical protein